MIIKNGNVFLNDCAFSVQDIYIEGGVISSKAKGDVIDATGLYVIPGLIDIHIHGCVSADASSGSVDELRQMSEFLATRGVTGFCPATMTLPYDVLERAFCAADSFKRSQKSGAKLIGINMEGPFFSMSKKGAQNPEYIKAPDIGVFDRLWEISNGIISLADVAPETDGAIEYIKHASKFTTVSLAHTSATFDQAKAGLMAGATSVTHLFNAMTPFNHRDPGVPGAVFESDSCFAELICDCIHIHPAVIKTVFKTLSDKRVCAISDALPCAGLPEGDYISGGLEVHLKDGCARLHDGTLAGSASTLYDNFKRLVGIGIPLESAVRACTSTPARCVGVYDTLGSIGIGKAADVVLLDKDLNIKAVIINGEQVKI